MMRNVSHSLARPFIEEEKNGTANNNNTIEANDQLVLRYNEPIQFWTFFEKNFKKGKKNEEDEGK